jgi:hypothetical protein
MAKGSLQDELEKRAGRAIVARSIYRWESAAILALTLILVVFGKNLGFPGWQWWYWLILGLVGEIALVWSSIQDPEFRARAVAEMFREKFRPAAVKNDALRAKVTKALEYRDRIHATIGKGRDSILRDHLRDVSGGVNDWMQNVFRLAQRLDAYLGDDTLRSDLQSVDPEIDRLKKRLALEDDDTVKRQISQTIAQKQIQRDNLRKLQNVMEQAQFQLESTITAMGTVYSQVMILGARDVASGRAQRLQQDVQDQVQALQDVVRSMDEVYQTGADSLGAGPSAADLAALDAQAKAGRKGTVGG